VSDRATADLERELAMLAYVRDRLRALEGNDVRTPTTAVDQVLVSSIASNDRRGIGTDAIRAESGHRSRIFRVGRNWSGRCLHDGVSRAWHEVASATAGLRHTS